MISVKDAVTCAFKFVSELSELDAPGWSADARLEEVESDRFKGTEVWLITLSIPEPGFQGMLTGKFDRAYRVFAVDKESGEVLSMKIREFAGSHV
jgi:hypothetical protein